MSPQEPDRSSIEIDKLWIQRQCLRLNEGQYVNDTFEWKRILNSDQADSDLRFSSAPEVLHVPVATCRREPIGVAV